MRATWLIALGLVWLAACGTRVAVGFADDPDAQDPAAQGPASAGGRRPGPAPFGRPSTGDGDASGEPTTPPTPGCDDKECGAFCLPCTDDAAPCPTPEVFHVCSTFGGCLPEQPYCSYVHEEDADLPPAAYSPCAGRRCGDECVSCDPTHPQCRPKYGYCLPTGACAPEPVECR